MNPHSTETLDETGAGKARYIMVGGFLGAGKTTAVAKLARHLHDQGLRVGLITNDQGNELVDTAMLRSQGFATEEISGGCFCCRFQSLTEAAGKLASSQRPDVFIAEPVGSCTDLVATVSYPLRRIYGNQYSIAPLSVLVDPVRARRVLGLEEGGRFSDKVAYIYRKQLEEADVVVINKMDLVDGASREELRAALAREFAQAEILEMCARDGRGMEAWFERLAGGEQSARAVMEVDYALYGEGEALLGWLNATVRMRAEGELDGNDLLRSLAANLQAGLSSRGAEIAHLKMTLDPREALGELAVINLVRNDYVPELSQELEDPVRAGQLIVNLRAEADPEVLREALEGALQTMRDSRPGLELGPEHQEHFKPGQPQPTHRDS